MTTQNRRTTGEVINEHESSGKYFKVDGQKTFALDYGTGDVVFCVHGVPASSFLYRKVLLSLAEKGYRAISIDLPGLGLSERPENFDYSFPGFTNFLAQALETLNVKNYHLVLHDIGGPIGFALAAKNMEKVRSLTVLNSWINVEEFEKPLPMRPFEKKVLGEAELKLLTHTTWPVMFSKTGVLNADKIPKEEIKAYVDLLKREDGGKAFLKIMRNFTDTPQFHQTCLQAVQDTPYPIQVIWGKDDFLLRYEKHGEEIKEAANLKEVTLLPSRHFLQEEVWQEIANKIDELANSAYQ